MRRILCVLFVALYPLTVRAGNNTVDIFPSQTFQAVIGSGAAFSGSSTYLFMSRLNASARRDLFEFLFGGFDDHGGAHFNAMRIVMGTCDFSMANYTYDELPDGVDADYDMKYFSIEADLAYVVPAIQEALAVNSNISIIASPWSAPSWMKIPQSLFGGNLSSNLRVREAYAKYFRKFVESYIEVGIPIFAVTVQNEPRFQTSNYPSMQLSPQDEIQMALLIAAEFEASAIINGTTKVIVYDHNWDDPSYPIEVLQNSSVFASDTIIGSAFHCYAGNVWAQDVVHDAVPEKRVFFTECTGGAWAPNFGSDLVWDAQNLVIGSVNAWAESVTKWNMALDPSGGPHLPSACTDCRGLLTIHENGTVVVEEDFYPLAHMSMWLNPAGGNVRVNVSDDTIALCIQTAETGYVLLLVNPDADNAVSTNVRWHMGSGTRTCSTMIDLPPLSLASVRWIQGEDTATWVLTTGDKSQLRALQSPAAVTCS